MRFPRTHSGAATAKCVSEQVPCDIVGLPDALGKLKEANGKECPVRVKMLPHWQLSKYSLGEFKCQAPRAYGLSSTKAILSLREFKKDEAKIRDECRR